MSRLAKISTYIIHKKILNLEHDKERKNNLLNTDVMELGCFGSKFLKTVYKSFFYLTTGDFDGGLFLVIEIEIAS